MRVQPVDFIGFMKTLDPGHLYQLNSIDNGSPQHIVFVKREGANYPGNTSSYGGTQTQEVIRSLIDRQKYVDSQIPHKANKEIIKRLRLDLLELEQRAAQRHGLSFKLFLKVGEAIDIIQGKEIELIKPCKTCGHLVCHCNVE